MTAPAPARCAACGAPATRQLRARTITATSAAPVRWSPMAKPRRRPRQRERTRLVAFCDNCPRGVG